MAALVSDAQSIKLDRLDHIPRAIGDIEPAEILSVLPHPTLIQLRGEIEEPLCLTVLLHGNETTSFYVLRELARKYEHASPRRSLLIFIGNVEATAANVRYLPNQPDHNRIWSGGDGPYHRLVQDVSKIARNQNPFASIDIHNNTGNNPLYGCVNALRPADLHLAAMFSNLGVYYQNPSTTQSIAFSHICPAITIECGQSGDPSGLERALTLIEKVLVLDRFPAEPPAAEKIRLFETVGAVVIEPGQTVGFDQNHASVNLRSDLESRNFSPLGKGFVWGTYQGPNCALRVINEHSEDLTANFFVFDGRTISLKTETTIAMLTTDPQAISQDCLCYLMMKITE